MKLLNVIFILLFILSAALQYNDPDLYVWMPIYLWGALLCYLALRGKYYRVLYFAGLAVYSIYAVYLFLDRNGVQSWWTEHEAESLIQSMKATRPWIEETREFLGLLILIFSLLLNMNWLSKKKFSAVGMIR